MNIGIFGGAFNPVHNGHLHLLKCMLDSGLVDKIMLVPTANPPHKTSVDFADAKDRFEMLRLAISEFDDKCEISDIEFHLEGKSYTFNTLTELKRIYPNDELYLFMGSDQLINFESWYRYDDILKMVKIVAMSRDDEDDLLAFLREKDDVYEDNAIVLDVPVVEVSSSQIRTAIRQNTGYESLVPNAVSEYIKEHKLYV